MKQVLATAAGVVVEEVPAPAVEPGTVLVVVDHSCVSVGTELSGVRHAETPLWRRALRDPAKVKAAVSVMREEGLAQLRRRVRAQASTGTPMGYSAAGTVVEVGPGIEDLVVGDRVACAGAGVANHAEVIRVPRNLAVPVPEGLSLRDASVVTLGAIALQGLRRAEPTLGETFVVIGLGAIGQLTAQLLRANGCRVVVSDLDARRTELAMSLGAHAAIRPGADPLEDVLRLTDGVGADGVIVTAASESDDIVSLAFRLCRKKARVVLVGDVGLNLRREDFYAKELDFLVSTSYGPGRYDRRYEDEGLDYPIGYVRWTENRNMREVVRLMADGAVDVGRLISHVVPLERASEAYALLAAPDRPLLVLLRAPGRDGVETARRVALASRPSAGRGAVRFAVVGPGAFAQQVHLPNIARSEDAQLRAVVGRTPSTAKDVAGRFGAAYATTELDDVLGDGDVDALLVATRHGDHAALALRALEAGKHVLVEKPLAIGRGQLEDVRAWFEGSPGREAPVLLTGYNRRFAPLVSDLHRGIAGRRGPFIVNYRMNAGYLPPEHWVHGPQGGGRNVGEACHIYDLFTFLTGSEVRRVSATAITPASGHYLPADNFVADIAFADGSVATLTYTALGSPRHPKEQLTLYADGTVWTLDDYRALHGTGAAPVAREEGAQDKGHAAELAAFVRAVRTGEWPVALWQQLQAMEIAFGVDDAIAGRVPPGSG